MEDSRDRRGAPRAHTRFMVRQIRHEQETPAGQGGYCETRNISRNGALCLSERDFPEFARIRVTLELETPDAGAKEDMECEGVVVRSDGKVVVDGREMFAFAIFFDRMSEEDRSRIDHYVDQHHPSGESE